MQNSSHPGSLSVSYSSRSYTCYDVTIQKHQIKVSADNIVVLAGSTHEQGDDHTFMAKKFFNIYMQGLQEKYF